MAVKQRVMPKSSKNGGHSLLKGPKQSGVRKVKGGKLTSVKNQIRGLQRLLGKDTLDQHMRRSLETKLAQLQESLVKHRQEETEKKFAVRYHKIRFFERVKVERQINKLEGKQLRGHALSSNEQQQLHKAKADLQYVMHFPKGERYVSILKEASDPDAQAQLLAERERLRKLVKHQLAEAALLAEPDEGLINHAGTAQPTGDTDHEADAFFLEDEPAEAPQAKQPVLSHKLELASALPASSESEGAESNSSFEGLEKAPTVSHQQPQQQQRKQQQQQQQQQQQPPRGKRKRDQPPASGQRQHQPRQGQWQSAGAAEEQSQATVIGSRPKPGRPAEHPASGTQKPVCRNEHVSDRSHPAALIKPGRVTTPNSHFSKAAGADHEAVQHHAQLADEPDPDPISKISSKVSTAADKSRRLLLQLQQKHMKPVRTSLVPAQKQALKGRHMPAKLSATNGLHHGSASQHKNVPFHAAKQHPRTAPTARAVKHPVQAIVSQKTALHKPAAASSGASNDRSSKVPSDSIARRTRAEGGRKRRR